MRSNEDFRDFTMGKGLDKRAGLTKLLVFLCIQKIRFLFAEKKAITFYFDEMEGSTYSVRFCSILKALK